MNDDIQHQSVKVTSAVVAAVAATTLTEAATVAALVASSLAALYTCTLLGEWCWKRLIKPWLRHRKGFVQTRRNTDTGSK